MPLSLPNTRYWPSPQDYNEAVQTTKISFSDAELRDCHVECNSIGLPKCICGNFASVFCFANEKRRIAVRCFLRDVPDQLQRYGAISGYVLNDDLEATVPCQYLEEGIRVNGEWFPILKMEWVYGSTLNQFLAENIQNGIALNLLASYFKDMIMQLRKHGLAHGDLQHDNILISDHELRLVDYDGMFVPALKGFRANELGHKNYQHPERNEDDYGDHLDHFSAWVIYASLKSLSTDPSLWAALNVGDDCLLYRQSDFLDPESSIAFRLLQAHPDDSIRHYASAIKVFLQLPLHKIPALDDHVMKEFIASGHLRT